MTERRPPMSGAVARGFGLAALVSPLPLATFLSERWPHASHVSHGSVDRFGGLAAIPALENVEALLGVTPSDSEVVLFGPDGFRSAVPSRVAIDFYRRGDTLYFTNVERHVPELLPFRTQLASDVGLPVSSLVCEAFASAPGASSSMHYDFDVNFNVLLSGSKHWQLALNDQIEAPEQSFVVGHSPWLESAISKRGAPPVPPADPIQREVARAGSVVFLPRGIWHETHAETACFGVNFTFKPRCWYQLIAQALAVRLREDARFRAYPFGALSAGTRSGMAAQIDELLPLAVERLKELSFEEVALAFQAPRYRWREDVPATFDESTGHLTTASGATLAIDEPLWPLARALTTLYGTFSPNDLIGRNVGLGLGQMHVALRTLCDADLLRPMKSR